MSDHLLPRVFGFGDFVLDVSAYELRRYGRTVKIERRPMELLILLVERQGELVSRDEIVDRLWGRDVFIDIDASVNTVMRKIRRALHDSAGTPRFIQTVQGKGYRFVGDVERVGAMAALAVLPFENLQGTSEHDYLADGLTEEAIAGIGQIDPERLRVIGRTSSMAYRGTTKSIRDIGRELGVEFVLEGSVRAGTERCRVTAKLIRVRDQMQIWTEIYDRDLADLLGLQAALGRAIAEQIHLRLSPERATIIGYRQTQHSAAYDLYLRGRYHWNQLTPATVARALECYERATELDPGYALAWAGIADTYSSRPFNSDTRPSDVSERARAAAYHALDVGGAVAEAHTAAAFMQFVFDWDFPAAEANCRQAVALDPNYGQGYWMLGHTLSQQGRHREALAVTERARDLDPLNAMNQCMSSQIAFQARDFEAAVRHARQALHVEPDFWIAHHQLGQAGQQLGRTTQALASLAEASRLSGGNTKPVSTSAYQLAGLGRVSEARATVASLERIAGERYVPPYAIALIHAGLNDRGMVYEWLEKALAVRDVHLIYLPVDAKWDPFRHEDRFRALIRRCGFGETPSPPDQV